MRKAMTPLISSIILIMFAVGLGIIVMSWGNEYTPQAIKDAGLKIGLNGLTNLGVDSVDYLKEPMILHDGVIYKNESDGFDEWDLGLLKDKIDEGILYWYMHNKLDD